LRLSRALPLVSFLLVGWLTAHSQTRDRPGAGFTQVHDNCTVSITNRDILSEMNSPHLESKSGYSLPSTVEVGNHLKQATSKDLNMRQIHSLRSFEEACGEIVLLWHVRPRFVLKHTHDSYPCVV
jgi:hypothetical protein